jgi:hypothetical protein
MEFKNGRMEPDMRVNGKKIKHVNKKKIYSSKKIKIKNILIFFFLIIFRWQRKILSRRW